MFFSGGHNKDSRINALCAISLFLPVIEVNLSLLIQLGG
ncbi:hypothetical protein Syncc8109_1687 [Synechococcus sp. WH 8109]|nr:hypothetical protein Syncc8109_1687 [Synechococcus sp. WH 8109]